MSNSTDAAALHLRAQDDLASLALGETAEAAVVDHVRDCVACQGELERLHRVIDVARADGRPTDDEHPPPDLWERIAAATVSPERPESPATSEPTATPATAATPTTPPVVPAPPRRRVSRVLLAAAAVVVVAAAGVGGWAVGHASNPAPASRAAIAELSAQPGTSSQAAGTATMHPSGRGYAMDVRTSGLPAPTGYYEVWLFDPGAQRMVAVGTLGPGGRGTFTLPAGIDVARYRVVDVSAQRFDGDPRHQRSVLRGPIDR